MCTTARTSYGECGHVTATTSQCRAAAKEARSWTGWFFGRRSVCRVTQQGFVADGRCEVCVAQRRSAGRAAAHARWREDLDDRLAAAKKRRALEQGMEQVRARREASTAAAAYGWPSSMSGPSSGSRHRREMSGSPPVRDSAFEPALGRQMGQLPGTGDLDFWQEHVRGATAAARDRRPEPDRRRDQRYRNRPLPPTPQEAAVVRERVGTRPRVVHQEQRPVSRHASVQETRFSTFSGGSAVPGRSGVSVPSYAGRTDRLRVVSPPSPNDYQGRYIARPVLPLNPNDLRGGYAAIPVSPVSRHASRRNAPGPVSPPLRSPGLRRARGGEMRSRYAAPSGSMSIDAQIDEVESLWRQSEGGVRDLP